jgi:hypothetical protein
MVASGRNSVCMDILKSKYKVQKDWLRKEPSKRASPSWKEIENAKKLLLPDACYVVGNGKSINIWVDPWVPCIEGFKPKQKNDFVPQNPRMVDSLVNPTTKEWNHNELQQLFDKDSMEGIIRITIPASPTPDKLIWVKDLKGKFTVKSAYHVSQLPSPNVSVENMWQDL